MVPSPNGGADREHKIVRPMIDIYQKMSEKYPLTGTPLTFL